MAKSITFRDVRSALDTRITIASAKGLGHGRVVLDYNPLSHEYHLYNGSELDSVYSSFGTQLAIARFNELVGP